jgi:ABC-type Fe3+/spermidine/putrescine transport system ATPase subunit
MSDAGATGVLRMTGLTRRFGEVTAVDRLSISIEPGEFLSLLGPSGCGKTTALRLVAGFERPDAGSLHFDGRDITTWSPQRRGFGMVFQNYALFPHLNVFENVAFGLRARKMPSGEIDERVQSTLILVGLEAYRTRSVQALSGGQQQRVAVARALAIEPPLLLLDEPLSNLDQSLRVQTRNELRQLTKTLGISALFVTHDQEEAFDLSDRIAVMRVGRIHQIGSPRELYEEPADRFVARFVGRTNRLSVRIEGREMVLAEHVVWPLPDRFSDRGEDSRAFAAGRPYSLLIRPEDIEFLERDQVRDRSLAGVVRDRRFRGEHAVYWIEPEDLRKPGSSASGKEDEADIEVRGSVKGPGVGERVRIAPKREARLHLFPEEDGR